MSGIGSAARRWPRNWLETQERYRTLFQTLPEGVIYYAADGLIMEANPAAREILGIDMEKILTWPLPTASQAVHEDGSPFQPEELPIKVALRTGNVVVDVVMGVQHGRTGERRWLRITAVPDARDADGRPQRAYAMFRDLTDERRVAAALREGAELMGRLRDANVLGVGLVGEETGSATLMTPISTSSATPGTIWRPAALTGGRSPRRSTGRSRTTPWRSCGVPVPAGRSRRSTCTGTGTGCRSSSAPPSSAVTRCAGYRSSSI